MLGISGVKKVGCRVLHWGQVVCGGRGRGRNWRGDWDSGDGWLEGMRSGWEVISQGSEEGEMGTAERERIFVVMLAVWIDRW